jgi:hypothetical protein
MQAARFPALLARPHGDAASRLARWLQRHRASVLMAGLLAFAAPLKFFIGYLGVQRDPAPAYVLEVGLWWLLYGAVMWLTMMAAGHAGARWTQGKGRVAGGALWLALACACAALANVASSGRAAILIGQGVVQGVAAMQLYSSALSVTMALLYFALLGRGRLHDAAAARLSTAQRAQREARRRIVQMELQSVQARIDPALLFGMLEAVRFAYATDAARAERLLEELTAFLRASLPRLRAEGSSVPREAELARAFAQLQSLAHAGQWQMTLVISEAAAHARFPPGALVPLVDDALRSRGGDCSLQAHCADGICQVRMELPALPSAATIAHVQALLHAIDGAAAGLAVAPAGSGSIVTLRVPHALA